MTARKTVGQAAYDLGWAWASDEITRGAPAPSYEAVLIGVGKAIRRSGMDGYQEQAAKGARDRFFQHLSYSNRDAVRAYEPADFAAQLASVKAAAEGCSRCGHVRHDGIPCPGVSHPSLNDCTCGGL